MLCVVRCTFRCFDVCCVMFVVWCLFVLIRVVCCVLYEVVVCRDVRYVLRVVHLLFVVVCC